MNLANFNLSFKAVGKLLSDIEFIKMKGTKSINNDGVSADFKTSSQKGDYFKTYRIAKQNYDFDFLLFDESFFQFSIEQVEGLTNARYSFYQNPLEYKSYGEFLDVLRNTGLIVDETDDEIGDFFYEEYEQFSLEQQINMSSTTIRYDIDYGSYLPQIHSVSHMHFGNANHVRIPCDKLLTPLQFVLLILKHVYYYHWKNFIENKNDAVTEALSISKNQCGQLQEEHWSLLEKAEIFLT